MAFIYHIILGILFTTIATLGLLGKLPLQAARQGDSVLDAQMGMFYLFVTKYVIELVYLDYDKYEQTHCF